MKSKELEGKVRWWAIRLCLVGLLLVLIPNLLVAKNNDPKVRELPDRKELMESEICKKAAAPIDMGFFAKEKPKEAEELKGKIQEYKAYWLRFCSGKFKDSWDENMAMRELYWKSSLLASSLIDQIVPLYPGGYYYHWNRSNERLAELFTTQYTKFLPAMHNDFAPFFKIKFNFLPDLDQFVFANRWHARDFTLFFQFEKGLTSFQSQAIIYGNPWEFKYCLYLKRMDWNLPIEKVHLLKSLITNFRNGIFQPFDLGEETGILLYLNQEKTLYTCDAKPEEVVPLLKKLVAWEKVFPSSKEEIALFKKFIKNIEAGKMKVIQTSPYTPEIDQTIWQSDWH